MTQLNRTWHRTDEPIFWGLFGAGGMVVAFATPVLVILTGLLGPFGGVGDLFSYATMHTILSNYFGKLIIWVVVSLQMWHACHRIYHGMHDLKLDAARGFFKLFWYGIAAVLTVVSAAYLWII